MHVQKYDPRPLEIVPVSEPAAGAVVSEVNPGRQGWTLVGVTFLLVTDANAGDRTVTVDYEDGNGLLFMRNGSGGVLQASSTAWYSFTANRGTSDWDTNDHYFVPLFPAQLQPGQALQINVENMEAGDQLSLIALVFQRETYAAS